jgi:hypothetical protein
MYELNRTLNRKARVNLMGAEDLLNFRTKIPAFKLALCGCAA